jgi:hypothetical protein
MLILVTTPNMAASLAPIEHVAAGRDKAMTVCANESRSDDHPQLFSVCFRFLFIFEWL